MLAASWIAGLLWNSVFNVSLIGGLAALPCWELLKRFRPKQGA
jgi:uncharacterized membrane protein